MKITKQTPRVDIDIVDVICNKCGESLKPKQVNEKIFCGLDEAQVSGEWCSPHLEQGCYYYFSVCEPCLFEFWKSFKIPVEINDYRGWS